jgi:heterotetrameric sarcosine oxidase delta subunit
MALRINCPNCGSRPFTEYWFGGEVGSAVSTAGSHPDPTAEFERIWYRRNAFGMQTERWFHHAGCRRWLTAERDTVTNAIHAVH